MKTTSAPVVLRSSVTPIQSNRTGTGEVGELNRHSSAGSEGFRSLAAVHSLDRKSPRPQPNLDLPQFDTHGEYTTPPIRHSSEPPCARHSDAALAPRMPIPKVT